MLPAKLQGNTFLASSGSFVMSLSPISDHGSPSLEWLCSQGRLSVQWKLQSICESDPSKAMEDTNPEHSVFYTKARPHVEVLGHQPNCKTFNLQLVLSAEYSGTGAQQNPHQRDQIDSNQQLMGPDAVSYSQMLGRPQGVLGRKWRKD